jgi:hypothetical protein
LISHGRACSLAFTIGELRNLIKVDRLSLTMSDVVIIFPYMTNVA